MISNQGTRTIEIFDPLGLRNNKALFKKYLPYESIDINDFSVQDSSSSSCALFCVYFICMRFFNEDLSFDFFMHSFFDEDDKSKNEEIVKEFVASIGKNGSKGSGL